VIAGRNSPLWSFLWAVPLTIVQTCSAPAWAIGPLLAVLTVAPVIMAVVLSPRRWVRSGPSPVRRRLEDVENRHDPLKGVERPSALLRAVMLAV
jgi:hypothetical protein